MTTQRIQLTDSLMDVIYKLSEGNPGALRAVTELLQHHETIDPDSVLVGIGPCLDLDRLGIYGPEIWMLYSDVCRCDISHMIALLRANQLGFVSEDALKHAIQNRGRGIDLADLCRQVKERLPAFRLTEKEEKTKSTETVA